jgi:hypothetical protein
MEQELEKCITKFIMTELIPLFKRFNLTSSKEENDETKEKHISGEQRTLAENSIPQNASSYSKSDLEKMKILQLKEICNKLGINKATNKAGLIDNILSASTTTTATMKKSVNKKLNFDNFKPTPVELVQDQFNNWIFEDLVFTDEIVFNNQKGRVVRGFVKEDGEIFPLTQEKIDRCNELKLQYYEPENFKTSEN